MRHLTLLPESYGGFCFAPPVVDIAENTVKIGKSISRIRILSRFCFQNKLNVIFQWE